MKRLHVITCLFCMLQSMAAVALVNPQEADIVEQDWMANILIKGSYAKIYSLFCKGSLIHEYWVMSSPGCFNDPFGTISNAVGSDKADYAVALGNLGGLYKVEERLISPDGTIMLLRLDRPAKNTPIRLLPRTSTQLKGVRVQIFGNETTPDFADAFFNPSGDIPVSCNVGHAEFYGDERMCYVFAKPKLQFRLLMARGQVLDPLTADASVLPLNSAVTPDPQSDRLYIDFSEQDSHPCHEDMGSPIIATLNGELVQVGLVVATGMATGVPMCNGSYVNHLISLAKQIDFINESIAKGQFAQQCPARAHLQYEKLTPTRVRFYWDEVNQADGYIALYTTAPGYVPIESVDLGNSRERVVELEPGMTYTLALQAYNSQCTGVMNRPVTVTTD